MIRMLLLCLTIFVASSSADEDPKETWAFKKLLFEYRLYMKTQDIRVGASLLPFEVQNGTETEKFTATSTPFFFYGVDDIRWASPCQKMKGEENTILCFAVCKQFEIQANMTIKGESLPESISFEYSNIYNRSMLVFVIEKEQDSLVKVKGIHLIGNFFVPSYNEVRDIERTPIIDKALQVACDYHNFSLSYFVKKYFATYFNELLENTLLFPRDN